MSFNDNSKLRRAPETGTATQNLLQVLGIREPTGANAALALADVKRFPATNLVGEGLGELILNSHAFRQAPPSPLPTVALQNKLWWVTFNAATAMDDQPANHFRLWDANAASDPVWDKWRRVDETLPLFAAWLVGLGGGGGSTTPTGLTHVASGHGGVNSSGVTSGVALGGAFSAVPAGAGFVTRFTFTTPRPNTNYIVIGNSTPLQAGGVAYLSPMYWDDGTGAFLRAADPLVAPIPADVYLTKTAAYFQGAPAGAGCDFEVYAL